MLWRLSLTEKHDLAAFLLLLLFYIFAAQTAIRLLIKYIYFLHWTLLSMASIFFFFLSSPSFTAHPYTDTQTLANAQFITNWIVNTNSMMKLGILFCILISLQAKTNVHSNPRIIQISVAILCYVWVFFSSFIIENRAALKSAHRTNPGQFRFSTELALT